MDFSTVHKKKEGDLSSGHPICDKAKVYHTAGSLSSLVDVSASLERNEQEKKNSFKYPWAAKNEGQYTLGNINTSHEGNNKIQKVMKHDYTYHAGFDNMNTSHGVKTKHDYTYHAGFGSDMKVASFAEKRIFQPKYRMQSSPALNFPEDHSHLSKNLHKSLNEAEYLSATKKSGSFKVLKTIYPLTQTCGIESTVRPSGQTMTPVSVMTSSVLLPDWGSSTTSEIIMPSAVFIAEDNSMTSPRCASTTAKITVRESAKTSTTSQKKATATINVMMQSSAPHSFAHTMNAPRWQTTEEEDLVKTTVFQTEEIAEGSCDDQNHTSTQLGKVRESCWNFHPANSEKINEQQTNFVCFWKTCGRSMKSVNELFHHVMQVLSILEFSHNSNRHKRQ